ncbi:VOC family protein [Mesobacillus subterraneus]|uniref:VOC family protein n=1 Tax=Mesobacillus subterraneus TaxID=285983 RepID=A0A427TWC2_9BACI|nr:VOC family protein [Mesobacillus subterraneus]RSD28778.1 VOC family protein [Mesobacillus subterraneus]
MKNQLIRVGTVYIPVSDPALSAEWYKGKLGAKLNFLDEEKAILDIADISIFLVKSADQSSNFFDAEGVERFVLTYEVNGLGALRSLQAELKEHGVKVGEIENRGHAGRNFVFCDLDGNKFDVWSELSKDYRQPV